MADSIKKLLFESGAKSIWIWIAVIIFLGLVSGYIQISITIARPIE
jgi:hypothetical protein